MTLLSNVAGAPRNRMHALSNTCIIVEDILTRTMDHRALINSSSANRSSFLHPFLPYSLYVHVMEQFHRRTLLALREILKYFYWPQIIKEVSMFVASCHLCNSRNSKSYLQGLLSSTPANSPAHRMSLGIIGPRIPTAQGYRWILVMLNHF